MQKFKHNNIHRTNEVQP